MRILSISIYIDFIVIDLLLNSVFILKHIFLKKASFGALYYIERAILNKEFLRKLRGFAIISDVRGFTIQSRGVWSILRKLRKSDIFLKLLKLPDRTITRIKY